MGQAAALLWAAEQRIGEAAVLAGTAIPATWEGDAARRFTTTAEAVAAAVERLRTQAADAARLAYQHESEVAATRAALAAGGTVAV